MKLYLARHGDALSSENDPLQPLSQRGIHETESVARLLQPFNLELDEIVHSTKLRAKQTAEILGKTLAPELTLIQLEGLKPNDPIDPILEEISTFDRVVLIVGHLPFMEKLLTKLLTGQEGISPVELSASCVICLEQIDRVWKISWMVSPRILGNL